MLSHTRMPIHAIVTICPDAGIKRPNTHFNGWPREIWKSLNKYRLGHRGIERIRIRVGVGEVRKVGLRIGAGEWTGIGYDVRRFAREAAGEKAIMRERGCCQGDAIDEHICGKAHALRSVARGWRIRR
jgi:hypothetical protein